MSVDLIARAKAALRDAERRLYYGAIPSLLIEELVTEVERLHPRTGPARGGRPGREAPAYEAAQPDSKVIARDLAKLIDRYFHHAADADQRTVIENLAGMLRHLSASNLALSTEIEHYAAAEAQAREDRDVIEERIGDMYVEMRTVTDERDEALHERDSARAERDTARAAVAVTR